jgi:hypothetical protein
MKRFLLSSLLLLAMGRTAFCYVNNGTVNVPLDDPTMTLVQLDTPDGIFVNNGSFLVDMSLIQNLFGASTFYETSETLNYTNNGVMIGIPGFDFENFPVSVGQARLAANFVNNANGFGGGAIYATNSNQLINLLGLSAGLSTVRVRATNVVDTGLIQMDNTGLIDILGNDLDLRRGRLVMTGGNGVSSFGINLLDFGWENFNNTNQFWFPAADLTPTTALSTFFFTQNALDAQMFLSNAVPYFQNLTPQPGPDGIIVWRGIYLQDNSPTNVTKNVFFDSTIIGNGAFHIEWAGAYRDPLSGQILTNYFYLSDDPAARRNTNNFPFPQPPDFSFTEGTNRQIAAGTVFATPGYVNPAPPFTVTNDYSYESVHPNAVLADTNTVIGGSPTNILGRIQLTGSHSMNLANTHILGPNYLMLNTPVNLIGNSNAVISAPYSDLNIGVTNGSLTLSNLLIPELPAWTGVPDAPSAVTEIGITSLGTLTFGPAVMGGIQAWSASYIFVDAAGFTNDVRMLLVNSALKPTTPALQKDVFLHAPNSVSLADELNIFGHFGDDSTVLTITTNNNSAFSLSGQLNFLSPDIFWSTSFTNLQFLTNWGTISTKNLANFAGNMFDPNSDRAAATPYQAFVNHGTITDNGVFIKANYFENSGVIQELLNNGIDIDISAAALATNSSFIATNGHVVIAANSLLISNGVINAGQNLTLTMSCFLSDGYVFGNQFGHFTNSVLPNVVTNGNIWSVGAGVRIMGKPATGDLLGTTITNTSFNSLDSINVWPGDDRGCAPAGFANNLALGRMIFNADAVPSQFTFASLTGSNALYVDSLEFQGNATNTDANGNFPAFTIQPGMKIYFAQAMMNGVSIAEKLNGKNGGGFCWVSNYAGVYSSTNIPYPDGHTYIFNQALAISPNLDSDGDGTVNSGDSTPIPAGLTFDITNIGPQPCGIGGGGGGGGGGTGGTGGSSAGNGPGKLSFPERPSNSSAISFTLAQGSYNGLFYETNGVKPASSGFFTATVTSKGGFTAKLLLGGKTYAFSKPSFDGSGHYSNSVAGKGLTPLTVDLQLVNNDEITGEVSGNGWTAQLLADRAAFNSKSAPPSDWVGKDTLLLTTETNSSTAVGDIFGSVTVTKSGGVQWSGTLPDGSKVTQTSALSQDGVWPFYAAPYGGSGSLLGWLQVTNDDSNIEGSAVLVVPAGKSGLYPSGLTNDLDAAGSSVTGSIGALSSSAVVLSGGSLVSSLTNNVMIFGKSGQNGTLQLSVNAKTGLFTGSVVDPNNSSQKLSFQGALLEKSGIGGGFFLNADKNQGGKVSLSPAN